MQIFEPHIHMTSRTTNDYEAMAQSGIRMVLEPSFWIGESRRRSGTFLDYFDLITNYETQRAAQYGIQHFAAVSVNPKEANDKELSEAVLKELPRYLEHPMVLAVGEIGFDRISDSEEYFFRKQLELAQEFRLPVLIHSPHINKSDGILKMIKIIQEMKYNPNMVLMDHNVEDTTPLSLEAGFWTGHTVYPMTKLSPERACEIVLRHGVNKMMLNSSADWGPSDPLMVYHTLKELDKRGLSADDQQTLAWENPFNFFAQSGKLKLH